MEIVFGICTVVGGIAGFIYLVEKGRESWGREPPDELPEPEPVPQYADRPLARLAEIVRHAIPAFSIVRPRSVPAYDERYDPVELLEPWACRGDFFCRGSEDIALFLVNPETNEYRLVVIREDQEEVVTLLDRVGHPSDMYLQAVKAGIHKVSKSVWKHSGGPKKIHLACDGIEFGTYESAARVFYWEPEQDEFREQWVSD